MSGAHLAVSGLGKSFRGLRAVHDVGFDVPAGAIHALIGPNGAGKTTIFNMIAGVYAPDTGSVSLDGRTISGLRPDQACDAGVGRTFQIVKPFKGLSVLENVTVGALHRRPHLAGIKTVILGITHVDEPEVCQLESLRQPLDQTRSRRQLPRYAQQVGPSRRRPRGCSGAPGSGRG